VIGRFIESVRGGHLADLAEIHDTDAIADVLDYGEIVRDEN
jgi:hypothetical protein